MTSHERLLAAINEYVDAEIRAGHIVDANSAASTLSSRFPQSGIAVDEIADIIEKTTVNAHGVLYASSRNGTA